MLDALRLSLNPLNLFRRRPQQQAASPSPPEAPILTSPPPSAVIERARPVAAIATPTARPEAHSESDGATGEGQGERRRRRRRRKPAGERALAAGPAGTDEAAAGPLAEPRRFGDLILDGRVARSIQDMGYENPSPIQAEIIPHMLAGRDVVGQAQTGTGKTAAFGIPLVQMLDPNVNELQAIVLVPTRELALQVSGELKKLAKHTGHRVVTLYGGQPITKQFAQLDPMPQIVVGTPGRVLDHMGRNTIRLDAVRVAVLDEADEMLDIG